MRQEPVGPYFADFVCREAKLFVEVDGATHSTDDEIRSDERRAAFLRARGFRLSRLANDDICRNLDGAMETILERDVIGLKRHSPSSRAKRSDPDFGFAAAAYTKSR